MTTVRIVLIAIGLATAAPLSAGAQTAGHHVWAWRENPHGTFADFNPRVSCDQFTQPPQ
jgi:hypothetical protein